MKRKSSKSYVYVQLLSTNTEFHCFIFFFLSRERDGGAEHRTNSDWLRSCSCFRVLQLSFHSFQCRNDLPISDGLRRRGGLCSNYRGGFLGFKFQNAVVCTKAHHNRHLIASYLRSANQASSFNACNIETSCTASKW